MEERPAGPPPAHRADQAAARRRFPWRWIILGLVAFVLVAGIVVGVGSYWWFSSKVETANNRTTPEVQEALDAEPSTTLIPTTQAGEGSSGSGSSEAVNIILIGSEASDEATSGSARSSTIMVLHLDPKLDFACMLSVPRDLYVDIPGHGKDRIKTAYTLGGPQLTIQTVKNVLGLDIHKYIEIDFDAFAKSVDSLGGIYVDVDRRYEGSAAHPIDLDPGYQLLNGADALAFARYRYDQNRDPGGMTRQQRVLAAAREQAMGWDLPVKVPGIIGPILDATATNLTTNEILKLGYWLVRLDGDRIRQSIIGGASETIDGQAVIVADEETLKQAVTTLLSVPQATFPGSGAAGSGDTPTTGATAAPTPTTAGSGSTATTGKSARASEDAMWTAAQKAVPFPLEAPGFVPAGFSYAYKMPASDGTYQIEPGGDSRPAVRMLYRYGKKDLYLGITATTWTGAPAASNGREVEGNGTTYTVVGTSGKIERVWWKKDGVLYFISNTLTYDVSKDDLLKMAESMVPVGTR